MLTVDQAIAAITGASTLATAFATFLTVREIARQRQTAHLPDLIPKGDSVEGTATGGSIGEFQWCYRAKSSENEASPLTPWRGITFYNIGMAAAKNIRIHWTVDVASFVKIINENAQRKIIPIFLEYRRYEALNDEVLNIDGKPFLTETQMISNQIRQESAYLLPSSLDRAGMVISVPNFLLKMYSLMFEIEMAPTQKGKGLISFNYLSAILEIIYEDLVGRVHIKKYDFVA